MKKVIAIMAVICLFIGLNYLFNPAPPEKASDRFLVGTNAEYPPYTFIDGDQILGFDIDVAREVCQRMGKQIILQDMPFEALIPALNLKRIDFAAAGLTRSEERAKRLLFTRPYISGDSFVIISPAEQKIDSIDALSGKRVLVNEGYTADAYLSQIKGLNLIRLPAPADAFAALASNRGDAFFTAQSTLQCFLSSSRNNNYHIAPITGPSDAYSLALSKDNGDLLNDIQGILDAMEADGTILRFKKKWNL
jgi:polar amino acid transport system substrate-binding protein